MTNGSSQMSPRVVVIGGGISGLAAALRLGDLAPQARVTLLEASGRLGGVLQTERRDGFLLERSADSFITNVPWAVDLCRRVGLRDELLGTNDAHRRALVVCRGRLEEVPEGFLLMAPHRLGPMLRTPVLSPAGKLRLACEHFVAARQQPGDESLASFCRRRLGREVFDRLVQPLVGGIYTADPEKLSMAATMRQFQDMERGHGSLFSAMLDAPSGGPDANHNSGARYSLFVAPRQGMSQLVEAIAARLPEGCVLINTSVRSLSPIDGGRWQLDVGEAAPLEADAVVVAVGAPAAAQLTSGFDTSLGRELAAIEYAGCAVVLAAYPRDRVVHPLDAFGLVVPAVEHRRILAVSFSSVKFAGRAPQDTVLLRVFVGGACQRELGQLPEAMLGQLVREELADLLGAHGEPLLMDIARWDGAMPQYHVGHLERVERIARLAAAHPNFALAGNAYHGVGIPQCIHSGQQAAEAVLAGIEGRPAARS